MTHGLDMAQSAGPLSQRLLAIRQHVASRESGVPAADKNPELLTTITAIAGTPKTPRAVLTFPALTRLSDGRILASCRAGTTKDSADETVLLAESTDDGCTFSEPWQPFPPTVDCFGVQCTHRMAYLTEMGTAGHVIACVHATDRISFPDAELFNSETEGAVPMHLVLYDSFDYGHTFENPRTVPLPTWAGPASLTSPLIALADGTLLLSNETNKHYNDTSEWDQKVAIWRSVDGGFSWDEGTVASSSATDGDGHIFFWDQRLVLAPDGLTLVAFLWTFDRNTAQYLDIHRRVSRDSGATWEPLEVLDGMTDQPARPALLPDGRCVLAWVDRFAEQPSIRAAIAPGPEGSFGKSMTIYNHAVDVAPENASADTGQILSDMLSSELWSFGLPFAQAAAGRGHVMIAYYSGTSSCMNINIARLRV